MSGLSDSDLENLLRAGESDRVEWKESLSDSAATRIREAICAFANDLPGRGLPGVVLVGVRYDGGFSGLEVTDSLLVTLGNMKTDGNIVPPPSLVVEKRVIRGMKIAVVIVLPSDSPPVRYQGRIHVRTGPRRGIATAQDERILNERRRFGNRPFASHTVPSTGPGDLNRRQFEEEYLPRAVAPDILDANGRSEVERLAATKMIGSVEQPAATILGLLVLGIRPRDLIPGSYVQFLRIAGTTLADPIADSADIDGTIADILRRLDDKLKAHNRIAIDLVSAATERRVELYPLAALQQLVRNAVMHRSYEATNAPVRVTWFDDRIEIFSPGGPFGTVTAATFGRPGFTDYRNPNLAEAMKILGFVQRFGVGIATARRLLAGAGHPEPDFEVGDGAVLVSVRAAP